MKCTRVRKHLPLLVGGDLEAEAARLLEQHLKSCLGCYREYQEYTTAFVSLKKLNDRPDVAALLDSLAGDVLAQLNSEPQGVAARLPRAPVSGIVKLAAAAAMLAVIVAGAFYLGQGMRGETVLPAHGVEKISSSKTLGPDRVTGAPGATTPFGNGTELLLPAASEDQLKPKTLLYQPQQLPDVQPAARRRGF